MTKRITTIKDIAKALGISVATVSRAMRDTYDVSAETRKLVLDTAAKMNYRPNFNATGLVRSGTHKIAVIIPAITNYYFSTVITGIQEYALEQNYQVMLYLTNDSAYWENKVVRELSLSSVDGLLACITYETTDFSHFEELVEADIPLVFFDRVPESVTTSVVVQDDYTGACMATEHLISQGYSKIAHLAGPCGLDLTQQRLQGYLDTLKKHNLESFGVIHSGFSDENGRQDVEELFKNEHQPDALFSVNDRKGIGAILWLREHDIRVGEEVGVIGFTNDPTSRIISPSLSTIAEPAYEIGRKSCEVLIKHIQKQSYPTQKISLPTELIVRESTSRGGKPT
ncbi:LacI family DNA-binding transcriptional regulator [Dyadobacter fermentans]|uniref:Transcriptional regulator, LacI family n=1 Tax=Dyadobacter fermentans (strain ATCC 700827 / DSM 18053 / CIP 107007 / KCTC 52180 / NS114) TaxID=471854 RepID=C6VRV7_DYAFD|nr:LacI family DNA-binding transcriptional regulator [Dyadobacter fermentans]ACT94478.1 transcriptional regulator, LacI family [Dyadobacter fermentans DSM 18053]